MVIRATERKNGRDRDRMSEIRKERCLEGEKEQEVLQFTTRIKQQLSQIIICGTICFNAVAERSSSSLIFMILLLCMLCCLSESTFVSVDFHSKIR